MPCRQYDVLILSGWLASGNTGSAVQLQSRHTTKSRPSGLDACKSGLVCMILEYNYTIHMQQASHTVKNACGRINRLNLAYDPLSMTHSASPPRASTEATVAA